MRRILLLSVVVLLGLLTTGFAQTCDTEVTSRWSEHKSCHFGGICHGFKDWEADYTCTTGGCSLGTNCKFPQNDGPLYGYWFLYQDWVGDCTYPDPSNCTLEFVLDGWWYKECDCLE